MILREVLVQRRYIRLAMAALVVALSTYASGVVAQGYPVPPPSPPPEPPPMPAPPPAGPGTFVMTPIVSNGAVPGTIADPALVNPWGLAASPDSPIWVANNATQTSTAYDAAGNRLIGVALPSGSRGPANATGLVFNGSAEFVISNGMASAPATFIFDGEGGTLLAWSPTVDPANALVTYDDGAGGAVYKGLAIASNGIASFLYATDFQNGKVDVFDGAFRKVAVPGGFVDPELPPGYAPFGIQAVTLAGVPPVPVIVVTYAQHAPENPGQEITGPGLGLVNVFDTNGSLLRHLAMPGGNLNAPWGVVLAPPTFGSLSNMLLIGNFGDGLIHAFDPTTGAFVDTIKDGAGQPIANPGLWGLMFGNGALNQLATSLYFAAGIGGETAGAYGRIDVSQ